MESDDEFSFSNENKHERVIVHIDIDCFYAQVEMILNPSLRNKPVGIKQKNIVVTCNYEARALGVEKLMTVKCAVEKCPSLILVNGEDLKKYREMSEKIYQILQRFSPFIEKLGLDENFIDVTDKINTIEAESKLFGHVYPANGEDEDCCPCGCTSRLRGGSVLAQEMRNQLKKELGITSCAGIAHNKLMAKLAGAIHKPNQQTVLNPAFTIQFKNTRNIPGVGSSSYKKLESIGITSIEELQSFDLTKLSQVLGAKTAKQMQQLSLGIDDSRVKITDKPKSIGAEDGFPTIRNEKDVRVKLKCLLKRVWDLVETDGRRPTQVKLTVRKLHPTSHSIRESRQTSLNDLSVGPLSENQDEKITSSLMNLFAKIVCGDVSWQVTLLGISFSGFPSSPTKNSIQQYLIGSKSKPKETSLPAAKRCRFDQESPSSSASSSTDCCLCPKGVDPLVFKQLPPDIQQELLAESKEKKQTVTKNHNNNNNLFQYFRKL